MDSRIIVGNICLLFLVIGVSYLYLLVLRAAFRIAKKVLGLGK